VPELLRSTGAGAYAELTGGRAALRRALDAPVDAALGLFADLDDEAGLADPAVWAGYEVPARFRLGRCGGHLREHTIHVEKTLALLGRAPSEVERMVRVVAAAYGRLEGACLGLEPLPPALAEATAELRETAASIRVAAG